jgi:arylsulfatase A-like enzyme
MYNPDYKGQVVDYPLYSYTDFLTPAELKHCRALYAAEVTLVDRWVGRLLAKISDLGLLRNTMVLLTTDHGFLHGEHGIIGKGLIRDKVFSYIPLWEEINHIPFIMHYPGASPRRSQAIVQPPDVMPTLIELSVPVSSPVDAPGTMHGASMAHVLRGQSDRHRDFAVSLPYLGSDPCPITVAKDRWTGILYPRTSTGRQIVDKAVDGYEKIQDAPQKPQKDMLFDVVKDPLQAQDVQAAHPEILQRLRGDLVRTLQEAGAADEFVSRWR